MSKKRVAIFGSTGSIGKSALEVIDEQPDHFQVTCLAANSNIDLLEVQAKKYSPKILIVYDESKAKELKKRVPHYTVLSGIEGLEEGAAHLEVDYVLLAMSGFIGIYPAIAAIKAKKQIGIANKEILVCAGDFIVDLAKTYNVTLLPIDSEHSALFQSLKGEQIPSVKRLILTASGGPFLHTSQENLEKITLKEALNHPTWMMGPKITIDSSTLMNKGLEVIEAYYLFGIEPEKIEVVVHPQSIIHSLVEYVDGSILAQLSEPSMKLPIQYALSYPKRLKNLVPTFDFLKNRSLTFLPVDEERFICLKLAKESLKQKKSLPCFLSSANEVLVSRFLEGKITWLEIGKKLEKLISSHSPINMLSLKAIISVDQEARQRAMHI